jgi:hypothetical protein
VRGGVDLLKFGTAPSAGAVHPEPSGDGLFRWLGFVGLVLSARLIRISASANGTLDTGSRASEVGDSGPRSAHPISFMRPALSKVPHEVIQTGRDN